MHNASVSFESEYVTYIQGIFSQKEVWKLAFELVTLLDNMKVSKFCLKQIVECIVFLNLSQIITEFNPKGVNNHFKRCLCGAVQVGMTGASRRESLICEYVPLCWGNGIFRESVMYILGELHKTCTCPVRYQANFKH